MKNCPYPNCPVQEKRGYTYVGHSGRKGSTYMIIGQRGGTEEAKLQIPFVGNSGQLLNNILDKVEINRHTECFITNAVGCGTRSGIEPSVDELEHCHEYVMAQIKAVQPKLIILLGGHALHPIYGVTTGIQKRHGRIEWNDKFNCWVMAAYHPAAALNDTKGQIEWAIYKDILNAKRLIEGKWGFQYPKVIIHETADDIISYLNSLRYVDAFTWDSETNSLEVYTVDDPKIACLSFATSPTEGHVIWLRDLPDNDLREVIQELQEVMSNPNTLKIGANLKYDNVFLKRALGVSPQPPEWDVIIAHRMIYTSSGEHGLKIMAHQFTNMGGYEAALDEYKGGDGYFNVPKEILTVYAGYDAVATWSAYVSMNEEIQKKRVLRGITPEEKAEYGTTTLDGAFKVNMDAMRMLTNVEEHGVAVDGPTVQLLLKRYEAEIASYEQSFQSHDEVRILELSLQMEAQQKKIASQKKKINRLKTEKAVIKNRATLAELEDWHKKLALLLTNEEQRDGYFSAIEEPFIYLNMGSSPQMCRLLYDICDAKVKKRSKKTGKPSVDEKALKGIDHPLAEILLARRHSKKMIDTYLSTLLNGTDPKTGTFHFPYVTNGAVSARLASKFHTFPAHGKDSIIRAPMVSTFLNGHIIAADFGQMELRCAASIADDKRMIRAMIEGEDLHRLTASKIFGVPPEKVTNEQRQKGKAINFGLIYDITPWGIVRQGIAQTEEEAVMFQDGFFSLYPGIKQWMDRTRMEVSVKGYASSPLGWWRDLSYVRNRDEHGALRMGINFPIQNIAGVYSLIATIKMYQWLDNAKFASFVNGAVHDSAYIDSYPTETLENILEFRRIAESGDFNPYFPDFKLQVPLKVDFKVGHSMHMDKSHELPSSFFDNPTQEALDEHLEKSLAKREEELKFKQENSEDF